MSRLLRTPGLVQYHHATEISQLYKKQLHNQKGEKVLLVCLNCSDFVKLERIKLVT